MPPRLLPFVPAIVAAVTDAATAVFVLIHQRNLPGRFIFFEIVMLGAALMFAPRFRWAWIVAFAVLLGGMLLASMTVGIFYAPTAIAAGWVMARRLEAPDATPGFLDSKPKKGVIYTESEIEAMRNRHGP